MPGGSGLVRKSAYLSVAGAALCAGMVFSTSAFAGAFAVREQSSYYQGMSFAGSAAGDDLSSMFWNSAAAAAAPGINTSTNIALVLPDTEITATGGAFLGLGAESGDIGDPTLVPASYANYQINESWFVGVALNSQYGFRTKPDNTAYAGSPLGITSEVFSVNLNPNLAYKLTDTLTVGVGVMVQYIDVRLRSGAAPGVLPPTSEGRTTEGDDWGVGATAGVIWKPMPGTSIGVGYRSPIDVELDGTCKGAGLTTFSAQGGQDAAPGSLAPCDSNVTADFTLPEMVTASFSQQLGERFRVLGTVEWTNWSRLGTPKVESGGVAVDEVSLEYDDGWFFSGGVEYAYTPQVTLRSGLAYEISPIDDDVRNVILPDDDRLWLSFGATMRLTESTKVDIGYSHLFIDDSPICQPQPDCDPTIPVGQPGAPLFVGESDGDIDIVTIGVTHNWGGAREELEPLK